MKELGIEMIPAYSPQARGRGIGGRLVADLMHASNGVPNEMSLPVLTSLAAARPASPRPPTNVPMIAA